MATYAATAVRAIQRVQRARERDRVRRRALDDVSGLAADLRAGAPPDTDGAWRLDAAVAGRVAAAVRLAERTGAPLAGVLERLEADLRAAERIRASAAAQTAGAKASAVLLAVLPMAGLAIGYALDVDPLDILLRTPIGAACLGGAITLQLAGLAWSARLTRVEVAA